MDKLGEGVGPEGRKLFENFLKQVNNYKLQEQQNAANRREPGKRVMLSRQIVQQRLGLFQIERIETFGEPQRADPKPLLTAEVRDLSG